MPDDALTPRVELRLELLVERMMENVITPQETQELERLIARSPEVREQYLRSINLRSALIWDHSLQLSESVPFETSVAGITTESRSRTASWTRRSPTLTVMIGSAAALLLVSVGVFLLRSMSEPNNADSVVNSEVPVINPQAVVAELEWVSQDAVWEGISKSFAPNATFQRGANLRLESGRARVRFRNGTQVTLFSPTHLTVDLRNQCILFSGSISVVASEADKGEFAVVTKNGKIIDIGTEFGVVVDDFGLTEVGVIKGKVVAYAETDSVQPTQPIELLEGDGLRWDSAALPVRLRADKERMGALADGVNIGKLVPRTEDLVMADDFDDGKLDIHVWKTLGHVVADPGSVQLGRELGGERDRDNVPYLITNQQFDPAAGTILVTGSVEFSKPLTPLSGSLSIFTRAENERGSFPRAGYAYLATGLRCTFWPVAPIPGQTMRVLVRPIPAGENVGLLGEQFQLSQDTSLWSFRLVDDGVNVLFSVQSLEDASIVRTVTCRSLFRGSGNSIAFEGDPNGSVRLRRIRVYQLTAS